MAYTLFCLASSATELEQETSGCAAVPLTSYKCYLQYTLNFVVSKSMLYVEAMRRGNIKTY